MEPTKLEIVDFILNESFQRYVLNKNQEDTNYWEEWLAENQGSATVHSLPLLLPGRPFQNTEPSVMKCLKNCSLRLKQKKTVKKKNQ
jgi:hypothetical protein